MTYPTIDLELSPQEKAFKKIYTAAYGAVTMTDLIRDAGQMEKLLPQGWGEQAGDLRPKPPLQMLSDEQSLGMSIQRHARYFPVGMHLHTVGDRRWYEFLCVYRGRCPHRIGSDIRILQEGEVVLLTPESRHALVCASDACIIFNLRIPEANFVPLFGPLMQDSERLRQFFEASQHTPGEDAHLLFSTGEYFHRQNYLHELIGLWQTRPAFLRQRLAAAIQLLMADLLCTQEQSPIRQDRSSSITEYIRDHIASVTVAQIAREFNYSPRQLHRIFHQTTGMNCMAFIQQYRMERFAARLRSSDQDIQTLMTQCGISSSKQFYASFREKYGTSPAKYRHTPQGL